VTSLV